MCLSNVYEVSADSEKLICEFVSDIRINGDTITLIDVLGQETTVTGKVTAVDLINNRVTIMAA